MTVEERLERIEAMLGALAERPHVKEWYSVAEFARLVRRSEFTCREWCRSGRINAIKQQSGRGGHTGWAISHTELLRYEKEGLRRIQTPSKAEAKPVTSRDGAG
jgi:hypothetical protein